MRILIYGLNYAPELTGIGKYTGEMAAWLAARGHQVRVVTAPPYYPAWKVSEDYRGKGYWRQESSGGPTVFRVPLWVPAKPTGGKRLSHLMSFMLASLPVLARQALWKPEVVLNVEPTFFTAPPAILLAKVCGAKTWLHIQDFEVDAAFELGMLSRGGFVQKLAHALEGLFTRAFDRVSSISTKMVERTLAKGVDRRRAVLFPNWVDINSVYPSPGPGEYRGALDLSAKVVLLYSGNLGTKQGLEVLAPLARSFVQDGRVHFLFCGDGSFRPQLEEQVAGLANVTLLPLQPLEKLNALLNTADIHLLPQRAGAADLVMPSKLTGMLSSGRPVIATADAGTQVADVVEGRGLVVPPEDFASLSEAVRTLIDDEPRRLALGKAAREYAEMHLGREQVLQRFETDLRALMANPLA